MPKKPTLKRIVDLFKKPAFRRPNGGKKEVNELLSKLDNAFFNSLKPLKERKGNFKRVRVYTSNGKTFVVKYAPDFAQGADTESVRNFIKRHHGSIRDKKIKNASYILRTPRVLAKKGDFLILEHIKESKKVPVEKLKLAREELGENFKKLNEERYTGPTPQELHFFPAGMHNGKVVLYAVYDYL